MKKLLFALSAIAALGGSARAADLPPQPYVKAPEPAPAPSWTGFYIFGGGGSGLWAADQHIQDTATGVPLTVDQRQGGSGWFGTVGLGYDWQSNGNWVAGLFADTQLGSLSGSLQDPLLGSTGQLKLRDSWAAGARIGYLVAPNVLSYVNGGYSGAHWAGMTLLGTESGLPAGAHTDPFTRHGWFIGGGVENNLNIFGISAPGLFMKTEYRAAFYGHQSLSELDDATGLPVGNDIRFNTWNQTISTSLVYRFNWTGPAVPQH